MMLGWGLPMAPTHQAAVGGGGVSLWPLIAFIAFIVGLGTGRGLLSVATPPDDIGRGPGRPPTGHPKRPDPIGGSWVDNIERWLWEGARGGPEPGIPELASRPPRRPHFASSRGGRSGLWRRPTGVGVPIERVVRAVCIAAEDLEPLSLPTKERLDEGPSGPATLD